MSIKVTACTVTIGSTRTLSVAQGEDREFRLTFTESGTARDMTGATAVVLTVRSRTTNIEIFSRNYSGFQGLATAGTPRFQVLASDTSNEVDGPHDCWVEWTDANGYTEQLLVESTFEILTGADPDSVTSPPAVPLVYGIQWGWASGLAPFWTGKSGGYNANDGVMAYDGSLGATAISTFRADSQGVTHYPTTGTSHVLASGWAYVGQHGGAGTAGPTGPTGPAGPIGREISIVDLAVAAGNASLISDNSGSFTMGDLIVPTKTGLTLTGARLYWVGGHGTLTLKVALWDVSGSSLITSTTVSVNATGIYTVSFPSTQTLTTGKAYYLTYWETSGSHWIGITSGSITTLTSNAMEIGDVTRQIILPGYFRFFSYFASGDTIPSSQDGSRVDNMIEPVFA